LGDVEGENVDVAGGDDGSCEWWEDLNQRFFAAEEDIEVR